MFTTYDVTRGCAGSREVVGLTAREGGGLAGCMVGAYTTQLKTQTTVQRSLWEKRFVGRARRVASEGEREERGEGGGAGSHRHIHAENGIWDKATREYALAPGPRPCT